MSYNWVHPVATFPVTNGTIRHMRRMTETLRINLEPPFSSNRARGLSPHARACPRPATDCILYDYVAACPGRTVALVDPPVENQISRNTPGSGVRGWEELFLMTDSERARPWSGCSVKA
eukprot:1439376-Pleurochrysis_carterae.AAC.6